MTTAFSYYPGCSLHSTAVEYDASVRAVFTALDVSLHEVEDWTCCGASSAHSVNHTLALALPARNLALAQPAGRDLVMPCAACFNRHKVAAHTLRHDAAQRERIEAAVGFTFADNIAVRPLLDVVVNEIGLERVAARVRQPLRGLKVVPYYGCLLLRPAEITSFDDPEHPTVMADLLRVLGAEVRSWSDASTCCGGGLALTRPQVAGRLVGKLAARAREAGAEALVTSCPLCQVNLEMRQNGSAPPLPIFYFTELMGLAFGLPEAKQWWKKHLIEPQEVIERVEIGN